MENAPHGYHFSLNHAIDAMIKKLTGLAATALFSLDASAAYIHYEIAGNGISGYFLQNEEDRSIASYQLNFETNRITMGMEPSDIYGNILWAKARYDNQGPTRFAVFDDRSEAYEANIWFNFSATDTPGTYSFTSYFSAVQDEAWPTDPWVEQLKPVAHYFRGTVTGTAVDAETAAFYDTYLSETGEYPGLRHIAPKLNVIPEPSSIAILALGAAGLAGAFRRRKPAR